MSNAKSRICRALGLVRGVSLRQAAQHVEDLAADMQRAHEEKVGYYLRNIKLTELIQKLSQFVECDGPPCRGRPNFVRDGFCSRHAEIQKFVEVLSLADATMPKYFIVAESFAAPFCSDRSEDVIRGNDPRYALEFFAAIYAHPAGLYAAYCYDSKDAYRKGEKPLASWKSNYLIALDAATKDLGAYTMRGDGPSDFEVNGVKYHVDHPKQGRVVFEGESDEYIS